MNHPKVTGRDESDTGTRQLTGGTDENRETTGGDTTSVSLVRFRV